MVIRENQVTASISKLLAEPLGSRQKEIIRRPSGNPTFDFLLQIGPYKLAIDMRPSGATDAVVGAIKRLEIFEKLSRKSAGFIRVVAVPYMGEVGKRLCKEAGVGWVDLSGNADLVAPGLLVRIEGRPNLFKQAGRPQDVFAPNSSRITRYLLTHHGAYSIRGLARETGMDPGFTSRIVSRLEAQGFIRRMVAKTEIRRRHDDIDVIALRDPALLLDAWRVEYKFFRHRVIQGHVSARTGEELVRNLAAKFKRAGVEHAATGLSAAWLFTHFAGFRLVTFYLGECPEEDLLRDIGFREDSNGANVWLVVPNDDGVFQDMRTPQDYGNLSKDEKDIRCVHPIQVYVDLKDHPERAAEAAEEVRNRLLKWGPNGRRTRDGR